MSTFPHIVYKFFPDNISVASLHSLNGQFDLVFVDMAFGAYLSTIQVLLERKLLAPDGVILVDNGECCAPKC